MTGYEIIQLPFPELLGSAEPHRLFWAMTDRQSQLFYEWLVNEMPVRIAGLEKCVRSTPGFASWTANFTRNSLDALGDWFARAVTTRSRSREEKDAIYRTGPEWFKSVAIDDWTLTDETFSLAYDIGMYLGRVIEENVPGVHWVRVTKPKRLMEYNMPALAGLIPPAVDPVGLARVLAYGLAEGKKDGTGLRNVYDTWAAMVPLPSRKST